jgi:hypothetical protein
MTLCRTAGRFLFFSDPAEPFAAYLVEAHEMQNCIISPSFAAD